MSTKYVYKNDYTEINIILGFEKCEQKYLQTAFQM